jgi:hypothetical protein
LRNRFGKPFGTKLLTDPIQLQRNRLASIIQVACQPAASLDCYLFSDGYGFIADGLANHREASLPISEMQHDQ